MRFAHHKLGLMFGGFFSFIHLMWSGLIAIDMAQPLYDAILRMHMIQASYELLPFDLASMLMLIVMAFLVGYLLGWLFAQALSWSAK